MYESFFQLQQRPFAAAALPERYFPAPVIEGARQALARCIERAGGAALLVGPSGSGKTLVMQLLAEQFRDRLAVAMLAGGRLNTRRALLQAILFALGLPYRGLDEGESRLALMDFLTADQGRGAAGMLLLMDEAQTYPIRLLEEVRLLSNLVARGQPQVRLVLAGPQLLEERFASPRMEAFSQRIATRCYLEPLDLHQTQRYVAAQVAAVGGNVSRVFSDDALVAIYRATDGIPRLINQVCDHSLMLAYAGGHFQVSGAGIEEAWADLQQLPAPWSETNTAAPGPSRQKDGCLEFGELEDLGDDVRFQDLAPSPSISLHQIEDHLAVLEEEFHPVATIGPAEVAVSIADPFAESFAEEEVVVDRYAAFDAGTFSQQPQVHSHEGRVLSTLLQPFVQGPPPPQLSVMGGADADELAFESSCESSFGAFDGPADDAWEMLHLLVSESIDITSAGAPLAPPISAIPTAPAVDGEPLVSVAGPEWLTCVDVEGIAAGRDDDQILVEDDPANEAAEAPVNRAAARRQEYRQLFTTLRRG